MHKITFLELYIIIFQNKNISLRKKMRKCGASLWAWGLISCPFKFRFVVFPSDWTKAVVPVSCDIWQHGYVWISFDFWFYFQYGVELLDVFCRERGFLSSAHCWIMDLWEKWAFCPLHGLSKVTNMGRALSYSSFWGRFCAGRGEWCAWYNSVSNSCKIKMSVFSSSLECGVWGITEPNSRSTWITDPSDSS